MSTIDIILTVFACVWAVLMVIAGYCCYKANKARQETCKILNNTKKRVEGIDYELGSIVTANRLLELLSDDTLIWTEFYPQLKQDYIKKYPENLDRGVKRVKFWYEPKEFKTAIEFIWIDNDKK